MGVSGADKFVFHRNIPNRAVAPRGSYHLSPDCMAFLKLFPHDWFQERSSTSVAQEENWLRWIR